MAFNFNWSPLTADADFYARARDLLTKALNKSPKPPIIVDDILVSEFNLGTVPPDLEILEIGDLAEDRFRGIFKMTYSGDAFLTLKTRVQVRLYHSQLFCNTFLQSSSTFPRHMFVSKAFRSSRDNCKILPFPCLGNPQCGDRDANGHSTKLPPHQQLPTSPRVRLTR
jgi:hypothetical protein